MSNTSNTQTIIGRLGQDPEVRVTPKGVPLLNFSLAYDVWQPGSKEDKTEWQSVVAWGKDAEFLGKFASKGDLVFAQGDVTVNRWKGKDGKECERQQISAGKVRLLTRKGTKLPPKGEPASQEQTYTPPPSTPYEDDIPF